MFRQNCSNNQSLAEHSDILFSYTLLIINVIVHPFNAFSIASMASVLAFSAMLYGLDVKVNPHPKSASQV